MKNDALLAVDEAVARIDASIRPLPVETVAVSQALGRVLAGPAHSAHPLPPFDQSAVDGYAVRHADLAEGSKRLALAGVIAAAPQPAMPILAPGTAMRIFTGGLLPAGADTVVRQESCQRDGDTVVVLASIANGADIRRCGEERAAGAEIAPAGTLIGPGVVGALALAGVREIAVRARPRVVVLVTGDEVVPGGAPLQLGQVPDANGPLLVAQLAQWGCPALRVEHVPDDEPAIRDALQRAFADADIVLTTGGVSVGDYDFVPMASERLGAERVLWKVAQKPGMPLYVARHGKTLLFGLPGNPASVLVNLQVYVRHAFDRLLGIDPAARWHYGRLSAPPKGDARKTFWLRARATTDQQGVVVLRVLEGQASHMLGNLVHANALAQVPGANETAGIVSWLAL